jgi:hypothetical protein
MRWKIDKNPKHGEARLVLKFAWSPTKVENYTVWLEFYRIREECINGLWVQISKHLAHWY